MPLSRPGLNREMVCTAYPTESEMAEVFFGQIKGGESLTFGWLGGTLKTSKITAVRGPVAAVKEAINSLGKCTNVSMGFQ